MKLISTYLLPTSNIPSKHKGLSKDSSKTNLYQNKAYKPFVENIKSRI